MAATGHFLTTTVTKLELLSNGAPISVATGFFLLQGNRSLGGALFALYSSTRTPPTEYAVPEEGQRTL